MVVKGLAELTHDQEILGSIPATSDLFSRELAKVNFYGVSALSKMMEEEITVV